MDEETKFFFSLGVLNEESLQLLRTNVCPQRSNVFYCSFSGRMPLLLSLCIDASLNTTVLIMPYVFSVKDGFLLGKKGIYENQISASRALLLWNDSLQLFFGIC